MNRNQTNIRTRKVYRSAGIGMLTVLAAGLALGIGTAPRYIEELCIGGGFGDGVDGGADIEQNGDIATDGSLQIGGELASDTDSPLTLSSDESIIMQVDTDNNGTETFQFLNGADNKVAEIDESGNIDVAGDVDVGDKVVMSHGASLNEDVDGELALANARFYVKSDFGATDGKGLYLRNTDGVGTGIYALFHYYNGGHRYWSVGNNGGAANNFVISNANDLSEPKLTLATDGDLTLAGGITTGDDIVADSDSAALKLGADQDFSICYDGSGGNFFEVNDGGGNAMLRVEDKGSRGGAYGNVRSDGRRAADNGRYRYVYGKRYNAVGSVGHDRNCAEHVDFG